jgi:putative zinc finger/helix-turn-helix YgiT family protein
MTTSNCPICGKGELQRINGDYETRFIDDAARERELTVRGVTRDECSNCGEVFLDDDATQKIEHARLQAMRRLAPAEIKAFREKLGRTQTDMAHLLGLGEKTYARWESGAYIQNAASDRYLRLLMASGANVEMLEQLEEQGDVRVERIAMIALFPSVNESESLFESSARFTELLTSGRTFQPCQV